MRLALVPLLAVASMLGAADAPPAEHVIVVEQAPDLARLREHLQQSPLGKIWALPELARLKQRLDDQVAALGGTTGIDLWALLEDVDAFRAEIVAGGDGARNPIGGRFALSFGSQAEA